MNDWKPAAQYLKAHCLAELPLKFEEVGELYYNAKLDGARWTQRLCMSHERLRAEVSGAEILIDEMKTEIQCLKDQLQQSEIDAGKAIDDAKYQAAVEAEREMRRECRDRY